MNRRANFTLAKVLLLVIFAAVMAASPAHAQIRVLKSFEPGEIRSGSLSTLEFEIDLSGFQTAEGLTLTDDLLFLMVIGDSPHVRTNCLGTVTAEPGTSIIRLEDSRLGGFEHCNLSVNVLAAREGSVLNFVEVNTSLGQVDHDSATLDVFPPSPSFRKGYTNSQPLFGERTTLIFTIDNSLSLNDVEITGAQFDDQLPLHMVIAEPANIATTCAGNFIITAEPGNRVIQFEPEPFFPIPPLPQFFLAAGEFCTVSVDVLPNAVGTLVNTTSNLRVGANSEISVGRASAELPVSARLLHLVKSYQNDPVAPGGQVLLEFSLYNRSRTEQATDITFSDNLDASLPGLAAANVNLANVCGSGSSLTGSGLLTFTGGTLAPASSCSFSVELTVPPGAPDGNYPNETSLVEADVGGQPWISDSNPPYAARDVLFVQPVPLLSKSFSVASAVSGETISLDFSITNSSSTHAATDIKFIDQLGSPLGNPILPADGFCGPSSSASMVRGVSLDLNHLEITGAELPPAGFCQFSVALEIPPFTGSLTRVNTTSTISATIDGEILTGTPASDEITIVGGPRLSKRFLAQPVSAGDSTTLEFTISSEEDPRRDDSPSLDYTNIAFTDDLGTAIPGLAATNLPLSNVCGAGSMLSGTTSLTLANASLPVGSSCTFTVGLQVPANATPGSHTNTTSELTADYGNQAITSPLASTDIKIAGLTFSKRFIDDPVFLSTDQFPPDSEVTLEFTLENTTTSNTANNIRFEDDLGAMLPGLVASLPLPTISCGASATLSVINFDSVLIFENGSLGPGESCSFQVVLLMPYSPEFPLSDEGPFINRTSRLQADFGQGPVFFNGVSDELLVSTFPPVSVSASVQYTESHPQGADPEISLTLRCGPLDLIEPNEGLNVVTTNGSVIFSVSAFGSPGTVCGVDYLLPPGYAQVSNNCTPLVILPFAEPGPECAITLRPTEAMFTVDKQFSDGNNSLGVPIITSCTAGALIVSTTPDDGLAFDDTDIVHVIRYFTKDANCTAEEVQVPGYLQGNAGDNDCSVPQRITDGGDSDCEIINVNILENLLFTDGFENCTPFEVQECYPGPFGTLNVGACAAGMRSCSAEGSFDQCLDFTVPTDEICDDDIDNDCDGDIDEGCFCDPLDSAATCDAGEACFIANDCDSGDCQTSCEIPGNGTQNSSCSTNTDCATGFQCLPSAFVDRCHLSCSLGGEGPDCPAFHNCTATGIRIGGVEQAVCRFGL